MRRRSCLLSVATRLTASVLQLTCLVRCYLKNQTANFNSRTVLVHDNNVEEAMKVLNGIMANEGMLHRWKITRRYEKPTKMRRRVNYEKSKAIYDEDMGNRIRFILRKNRMDPYPGTTY